MSDNNVLVNGRSIVTTKSGGTATAFPDVCKTPTPGGPPVPVPYTNIAKSADVAGGPTSVSINDGMPFTNDAKISKSTGNEPGSAGGMLSGVTGGEAVAISHSFDVQIEGQFVVRNMDVMMQNGKNAVGAIAQPQPPPPAPIQFAADDDVDEEADLACELCGGGHTTPRPEPGKAGNNLRCGRRINRLLHKKNGYGAPPKAHPWYAGPGSLEAHHLICCSAVKGGDWAMFCRAFGYDINDTHNSIYLPALDWLACYLHLARHKGNHNHGFVYDSAGERLDTSGRRAKADAGADEYLTYPNAVKRRIKGTRSDAMSGAFCSGSAAFRDRMTESSLYILQRVGAFEWTLREDGRNYASQGAGCGSDRGEADCREHRSRRKRTNVSYAGSIPARLKVGF